MKIDDYVRTKKGIGKITNISIPSSNNFKVITTDNFNIGVFTKNKCRRTDLKFKSKPNITDLLEPQDLMYIDIDNGYAGGIVVPRIAETLDELNEYIDKIKKKEITLVGVVTHEQLRNMVYKEGEDNEKQN